MRRLTALFLLTLLAVSAMAGTVLFQRPGAEPKAYETTTINGVEHMPLEEMIEALRSVDPEMSVSWDSTQSLRLRILGTRVSLFTDSASVLVEARLHRTDGPLVNSAGQMMVPASVLRDMFEHLPAAPQVSISLPSRQINEPTVVVEPEPMIPIPTVEPVIESIPAMTPVVTSESTSGPIALVAIVQQEGDRALLDMTIDSLRRRVALGTGREVEVLEAHAGRWEPVAVNLQELSPALVLALQVGHSSEDNLRGVGVFHMSTLVDAPAGMSSLHSRRYRPMARLSEVLSLHLENELRRTEIDWLGRTPVPHRLLRIIEGPAVLVEIGQAGNADEARALEGAPMSAALAGAIAQAVIDFQNQLRAQGVSL